MKEIACYKCKYRDTRLCPFRAEQGGYEPSSCNRGEIDQSLIPEGGSDYDIPEPEGWRSVHV
jgi:hypothetical protein